MHYERPKLRKRNANNAKLQSFATLSEFYQVRVSVKQQFPVTRDGLTKETHMYIHKKRHFQRLHNEEVVEYWYQWDRYGVYARAMHPRPISFMFFRFHKLVRLVSRHQHTCVCTHACISKYSLSPTSDLSCRSRLRELTDPTVLKRA